MTLVCASNTVWHAQCSDGKRRFFKGRAMSCWRVIRAVCLSAFCAPAIALAGEPGADQGPLSENERSPTLLASDSELPPGPLSFAPSLGFTTFNGHPAYNVGGRGVLLL